LHDAVESDVRDIADLEICKLTDVYVDERVQGLAIGEAALAKLLCVQAAKRTTRVLNTALRRAFAQRIRMAAGSIRNTFSTAMTVAKIPIASETISMAKNSDGGTTMGSAVCWLQ
jgi:hypothetical protein